MAVEVTMYTRDEVERRAKQAMKERVSIVYHGDRTATVKNNSKGTSYRVNADGKCTCMAGRTGGHCKHVALVIFDRETRYGRRWLVEPSVAQQKLSV